MLIQIFIVTNTTPKDTQTQLTGLVLAHVQYTPKAKVNSKTSKSYKHLLLHPTDLSKSCSPPVIVSPSFLCYFPTYFSWRNLECARVESGSIIIP